MGTVSQTKHADTSDGFVGYSFFIGWVGVTVVFASAILMDIYLRSSPPVVGVFFVFVAILLLDFVAPIVIAAYRYPFSMNSTDARLQVIATGLYWLMLAITSLGIAYRWPESDSIDFLLVFAFAAAILHIVFHAILYGLNRLVI